LRDDFVMSRIVPVLLCLSVLTAACGGDSPSSPSTPLPSAPYSQTDLRVGTGAEAVNARLVTVNYTGWLYDPARPENKGTQFDSSLTAGRLPFQFTLGARQVIAGWEVGVPGMRVGGQRRLVIPPSQGYGSSGSGNGTIPGGATLVFDIELLNVQ
jgi:FKBP-type peptidyl-prolyl cis-trans isomerase